MGQRGQVTYRQWFKLLVSYEDWMDVLTRAELEHLGFVLGQAASHAARLLTRASGVQGGDDGPPVGWR